VTFLAILFFPQKSEFSTELFSFENILRKSPQKKTKITVRAPPEQKPKKKLNFCAMGPKLGNRFRESPRRRWRRSSGTTRASFVRCCYRERDREGEKRARAQVGDLWSRASVIKLEFNLKRWRCRIWEDFDYRGAGFCCDRVDSLEEASEEVSESNNCERTDGHCRFIPSSSFSSSSTLLRRIVAVCSDSE